MPLIDSIVELRQQLSSLGSGALVGIEGFMSSGKSHLANQLGAVLGCHVVHTDDSVLPGDESLPYLDRLNYVSLKYSLVNAKVGSTLILVDGICLRQVLSRLQFKAAAFVYVKRMAKNGLWHDGFHLEDFEGEAQSAAEEPEKSDLSYHAKERPHERADFVFHRVE